jgi:hypothetical protein
MEADEGCKDPGAKIPHRGKIGLYTICVWAVDFDKELLQGCGKARNKIFDCLDQSE